MKSVSNLLLILLIGLNLNSCLITDFARSLDTEIMKPAIFSMPENTRKVAILNIDTTSNDSLIYLLNMNLDTIRNVSFSNETVDALAEFLQKENYFDEVRNYRDSLTTIDYLHNLNKEELLQRTQADLCILLNQCKFNMVFTTLAGNMVVNNALLDWLLVYKGDSATYLYEQKDTLMYDDIEQQNTIKGVRQKLKQSVINSSIYMGRSFGAKVIPSWVKVERMYYHSNNQQMMAAEKYALNNQWLKAAEIWKRFVTNRNEIIAAKACYNMALACEMEGNIDAAIDWAIKSYSGLTVGNEEHKKNCKRYIDVLALRKIEIARLEKQFKTRME